MLFKYEIHSKWRDYRLPNSIKKEIESYRSLTKRVDRFFSRLYEKNYQFIHERNINYNKLNSMFE